MKRWLPASVAGLVLLLLGIWLCTAALEPGRFTGTWYSCRDGAVYTFENGLLTCGTHESAADSGQHFCGAYVFCGQKILVFSPEVNGLESEKELHFWKDALSEKQMGTGHIYFSRTPPENP